MLSYSQKTPVSANDGFKTSYAEKVKSKFNKDVIELEKSSLVSNVLKIINKREDEDLTFTLDILLPADWNSIVDTDKIYNLKAKDTIVVPILIIPKKLSAGNSEIIVNAFLIDESGDQIGDNSFLLKTKKKINWDIGVKKANKFYFKNDEFEKLFEYSIENKGNYKQDISIIHKSPKRDMQVQDTLEHKNITLDSKNITLDVGEHADFSYYASAIRLDERNKRKVSNTDYTPYQQKYFKKYDLVINSAEDRSSNKGLYRKNAKLSFVKLPNEIEMEQYGYPTLPLIMDLYAQNVLGDFPFVSLNLRGIKQLSENSNLLYNANINISQSYNNAPLNQNVPWYIGYFDDKKSVEIGQINSNIIGIANNGRGVKASYRIGDYNSLSAFYTRATDNFQNTLLQSYGVSHNFNSAFISLRTQYGRTDDKYYDLTRDVITLNPRIRIAKKHTFNLFLAQSTLTENIPQEKTVGYLYGANLSSNFKNRYRISLNGRYTDPKFGYGGLERINANHRSTFKLNNKWNLNLNNNFQKTQNRVFDNNITVYDNSFFNNRFTVGKKIKQGTEQYGVYYDLKKYFTYDVLSRGLSYRYSTFNNKKNLQLSFFLRGGLTKQLLDTPTEDEFSFDFTSLSRYRTWNITLKYNLGNYEFAPNQNTGLDNAIPQFFRTSVQNQYTFKNRKFILETTSSLTYRNIGSNTTFGLSPELFYYTKSKWRFGLRASYYLNSSDYSYLNDIVEEQRFRPLRNGRTKNSNFTLGLSMRKEFGIPIPFAKKRTTDVTFIAFKDINGNGIKDKDELPLNNVVITLDRKEVITTPSGVAQINRAPNKKMKYDILALEDLKGWFPEVGDSIVIGKNENIFVPFVRGVKLHGNIIVDRQKIAITDEHPMDLSRIKITATKDKVYQTLTDAKGHFEMYLPNGEYILTMNENILSSNLRLSRNNIPVVLKNNQDGYYISFYITEKRRKVIMKDFSKKKNN